MFAKIPLRKVRLGLLVLIGLLALALTPGLVIGRAKVAPAHAPTTVASMCSNGTSFELETKTGYMQTPDGNSLFMWTYGHQSGGFQIPSPVLCVESGQQITVELVNHLAEPASITFPGQSGVTATGGTAGLFGQEAAANGGSVTYTFAAAQPGTYLYESGSNPHKQIEMGLYGILIVRPAGHPDWAYDDSTTAFDPAREYLLVMHDLDPALHQAVERNETYDITNRRDHYWTINGRSFPDSISDSFVPWLPNQPYGALVTVEAEADPDNLGLPALIRYANAGLENHPFHPHGNHMRMVGRDGRPLSLPFDNFTTTIGSGQTYDLLFRWVNVDEWGISGAAPLIRDQITYPNIFNLVFKDGLTWFSGDPSLGVTADFPPQTTIMNECGEFYFPWHSHALNEFQNFDEGFGGLATLVRVDPPGGCQ